MVGSFGRLPTAHLWQLHAHGELKQKRCRLSAGEDASQMRRFMQFKVKARVTDAFGRSSYGPLNLQAQASGAGCTHLLKWQQKPGWQHKFKKKKKKSNQEVRVPRGSSCAAWRLRQMEHSTFWTQVSAAQKVQGP